MTVHSPSEQLRFSQYDLDTLSLVKYAMYMNIIQGNNKFDIVYSMPPLEAYAASIGKSMVWC